MRLSKRDVLQSATVSAINLQFFCYTFFLLRTKPKIYTSVYIQLYIILQKKFKILCLFTVSPPKKKGHLRKKDIMAIIISSSSITAVLKIRKTHQQEQRRKISYKFQNKQHLRMGQQSSHVLS